MRLAPLSSTTPHRMIDNSKSASYTNSELSATSASLHSRPSTQDFYPDNKVHVETKPNNSKKNELKNVRDGIQRKQSQSTLSKKNSHQNDFSSVQKRHTNGNQSLQATFSQLDVQMKALRKNWVNMKNSPRSTYPSPHPSVPLTAPLYSSTSPSASAPPETNPLSSLAKSSSVATLKSHNMYFNRLPGNTVVKDQVRSDVLERIVKRIEEQNESLIMESKMVPKERNQIENAEKGFDDNAERNSYLRRKEEFSRAQIDNELSNYPENGRNNNENKLSPGHLNTEQFEREIEKGAALLFKERFPDQDFGFDEGDQESKQKEDEAEKRALERLLLQRKEEEMLQQKQEEEELQRKESRENRRKQDELDRLRRISQQRASELKAKQESFAVPSSWNIKSSRSRNTGPFSTPVIRQLRLPHLNLDGAQNSPTNNDISNEHTQSTNDNSQTARMELSSALNSPPDSAASYTSSISSSYTSPLSPSLISEMSKRNPLQYPEERTDSSISSQSPPALYSTSSASIPTYL